MAYRYREAEQGRLQIVQTNSAGDNVHIIDPATNQVAQVIDGIPKVHGGRRGAGRKRALLQQ